MKLHVAMSCLIPPVLAVAVLTGEAPADTGEVPANIADPCKAVTPRSLDAYAKVIDQALRSATADASKNGSTGKDAVAATNSRDLLKRAHDRATKAAADLRKFSPSVTTAAEAGTVKEHLRYALEVLPQAAHWSIISEIYHDSPAARQAFEGSVTAIAKGNQLFGESGRCYMNGL